jgi:hypothetical protein
MLVQSDLGDGVGVVVVALAATACAQQPHLRGERGRDIEDVFAGGCELLGDAPAEAIGALDGELSEGPAGCPAEQGAQCPGVDGEPAAAQFVAGGVQGDRGERGLVGELRVLGGGGSSPRWAP